MKQGVSLDSFYAEATCSPSRVAIMTGRRNIMGKDGVGGSSSLLLYDAATTSFGDDNPPAVNIQEQKQEVYSLVSEQFVLGVYTCVVLEFIHVSY
jgi:hypothetical protein